MKQLDKEVISGVEKLEQLDAPGVWFWVGGIAAGGIVGGGLVAAGIAII